MKVFLLSIHPIKTYFWDFLYYVWMIFFLTRLSWFWMDFRHQHLQTLLGALPVAAALRYSRLISLNVLSPGDQASLWKRPAPNSAIQREIAMAILQPPEITGSLLFPASSVISNPTVTLVFPFPDEKIQACFKCIENACPAVLFSHEYCSTMTEKSGWMIQMFYRSNLRSENSNENYFS